MGELFWGRSSGFGVAPFLAAIRPRPLPKLADRSLVGLPIAHAFQSACWSMRERLSANNQRWIGVRFGIGVGVEVRACRRSRKRL